MGFLNQGLPEELKDYPLDLFLSYAHGSYEGNSDSELKRWSQQFALDLQEELAVFSQLKGLSLFVDEQGRGGERIEKTEDFKAQLKQAVQGAAILTLLTSPQYSKSEWCRLEREWWLEKNSPDKLSVGGRLFPCHVMPMEGGGELPDQLKGILGYDFYDRDEEPEMIRPFGHRGTRDDRYSKALVRVVAGISQRLKAIRSILDGRHAQLKQQQKNAALQGQLLYLQGRTDHSVAWQSACDLLQDQQFVVNPEQAAPLPDDGGLQPEYLKQLTTSDGLLILGTRDGSAVDSDMSVIGRYYRHAAIGQRGTPLPCAIFDVVGGDLKNDRRLRNARNLGIDWIDATNDNWLQQTRHWLGGES